MILSLFTTFAVVGAISGFLAGLLGIGGGLVIVPALVFFFGHCSVDQSAVMYLALGTSMGCIVFTSISSGLAHHKKGTIRWDIVKKSIFGVLIGTFGGTYLATQISTEFLKVFFVVFLYSTSIHMLIGGTVKSFHQVPGNCAIFVISSIVGSLSSLVGIGGGTLSVPLMTWCKIEMHNAIATSAAIGCPIAIAGTVGYIWRGIGVSELPSNTLGYIYIPALVGIVCVSAVTAPLGVKIAHNLPVVNLRRIFAIFLIMVGTKMLLDLFLY